MRVDTQNPEAGTTHVACALTLVHVSNPEFSHWSLGPGSHIVGREADCDIMIEDCTISRRHATLLVLGDRAVRVFDLGSRNGTWVNDRRVDRETVMQPGDQVTFGVVRFMLQARGEKKSSLQRKIGQSHRKQASQRLLNVLPVNEALTDLSYTDFMTAKAFQALSSMAIAADDGLEDICRKGLKRLARIIKGERYAVFLTRDNCESVDRIASYHGTVNSSVSAPALKSRSILREVISNKRAVHFRVMVGDRTFTGGRALTLQKFRSILAVPLINRNRVFGVLYADTTQRKQRYSADSLQLMGACAQVLSPKIAQHRVVKMNSEQCVIGSELRLASRMQQELMPDHLPKVGGYAFHAYQTQCKQVGGDLYDIGKLADGRVMFMVADVSGKGMGAALLASSILAAFRILRGQTPFDLTDAVRRVSLELINSSRMADFATLFIGILDPAQHRVEYVNAGHEPPLLVSDDASHRFLESGNMAIGVLDDVTWRRQAIDLLPGDRLLLCTDGLLEATDASGGMYGRDRMVSFAVAHREVSTTEFARVLIDDARRFRSGEPPCDDVTMILLDRDRD